MTGSSYFVVRVTQYSTMVRVPREDVKDPGGMREVLPKMRCHVAGAEASAFYLHTLTTLYAIFRLELRRERE